MTTEEADRLYEVAFKMCAKRGVNIAECADIAQEALLRVYTRSGIKKPFAWIATCAINLLRRRSRNQKIFERHAPVIWYSGRSKTPQEILIRWEMLQTVKAMLEAMTPKQRTAVEKWLRKRSHEGADNSTGMERALVFRALSRCRKMFPKAEVFVS